MRVGSILSALAAAALIACQGSAGGPASGDAVTIHGLSVVFPKGWQRLTPTSTMRAAQAAIPGDGGPGELVVFFFGTGQGGDAETNIARWIAQVDVAPGTAPQREALEHDGLRITVVDVTGTLRAGQMGMGPKEAQPSSRLLGAVVEGDGGPWFFKATGSDKTLAPQREAFVEMLKSLRLQH